MLLVNVPAVPVLATTLTVTVQLPIALFPVPAAGTVAPDKAMLAAPETALTLPPVQVVTAPVGAAATTIPAGKLSVNVTPVSAVRLRFCSVKVSVEVAIPLARIVVGENVLPKTAPVCTDKLPLLMSDPFVAPSVLVIVPAAMLLMTVPLLATLEVAAVTVKVNVQEPCFGIVAPAKLAEPAPATTVSVPPVQVVEAAGVLAIATPVGRVSVKATPLRFCKLGLLKVMVTTDVPPPP